ncbi:MAG: hypothetical protein AAF573_23265, partial [Bacteroidota bacterium]
SILFYSCQGKVCDSIIFVKEIEKPTKEDKFYGKPSICIGLFIVNNSEVDTLKIYGDNLLYFYNSVNERTYLRSAYSSNSNFELSPNSNDKFCLFVDKETNNYSSLEEFYSVLIKSTFYIERDGIELEVCN